MSNNDDELRKKLLSDVHDDDDVNVNRLGGDDEEEEDLEEQKKKLILKKKKKTTAAYASTTKIRPIVVTKTTAATTTTVPCWCRCIGITVLIVMTLTLMVSGITYLYVKDVVQHLTVTTPHAAFPVVEMTDAELRVVKDRVTLFVDELFARAGVDDPLDSSSDDSSDSDSSDSSDSSSSSSDSSDSSDSGGHRHLSSSSTFKQNDAPLEPLVITQDEINGFLGHSDYLRGNMMVTLADNVIHEEYSLPTWMLPGGSGRYFVGEDHLVVNPEKDEIQVKMTTAAQHHDWFDGPLLMAQLHYLVVKPRKNDNKEDVMLQLFLEQGSFFGQDAPQDFIDRHQNLLEDVYGDAGCDHARAILSGIERVSIETGKITFVPRN